MPLDLAGKVLIYSFSSQAQGISSLLKSKGYEIVLVTGETDIQAAIQGHDLDLAIVDHQNQKSAFDFAEKIRSLYGCFDLPIIFLSMKADRATLKFNGFEHAPVMNILKPYSPVELLNNVDLLCRLRIQKKSLEKAKSEAIQSTFLLRKAQVVAQLGFWQIDLDTGQLFWSEELRRIVDLSQDEKKLQFSDYLQRIHPEDRPLVRSLMENSERSGVPHEVEYRIQNQKMEMIYIHSAVDVEKDANGKVVRLLGIVQDFTDRVKRDLEKESIKEQMQTLENEKKVAERMNQKTSMFLANISHELRTPMHGILSFARFGQQKIDSPKEKLKSYFDEIHDSGTRLMSLLNDLLDLAKLEAGKMELQPTLGSLFAAAKTVADSLRAYAEEHGHQIEVVQSSSSADAIFDEKGIQHVLQNLISNALKFAQNNKLVRVEIEVVEQVARCRVINWGIGIPKEELEVIFDKFVQSSRSRTGAGGTGLGLPICKEIIHCHHGRIWAESDADGKTTFIFEFSAQVEVNGLKKVS